MNDGERGGGYQASVVNHILPPNILFPMHTICKSISAAVEKYKSDWILPIQTQWIIES